MYNIEESVYKNLIDYFKRMTEIEKVILFGSRAKGIDTLTSDIDLCITYEGRYKGTLVFELEEIVGIYSLDIVFEDKVGPELSGQIQRDGKIIYKRDKSIESVYKGMA